MLVIYYKFQNDKLPFYFQNFPFKTSYQHVIGLFAQELGDTTPERRNIESPLRFRQGGYFETLLPNIRPYIPVTVSN